MGAASASVMVASKTARVPILAAREGGQAEVFELEMESRPHTNADLFPSVRERLASPGRGGVQVETES